ncbi:MAG: hypothetical protein HZB43_05250 [candidate division Zixibacteria bacterium]|nr:hypothetical protein [candidate division Zixibacteria bacterium]
MDIIKSTAKWEVRLFALASVLIVAVWRAGNCGATDEAGSAAIVGIGGAYAGSADDAATIWLNPALTAFSTSFVTGSLATRNLYQLEALRERTGSVTVRIAKRAVVGAGFAQFGQPGLYTESHGVMIVSAEPWRKWTVGAGVRYDRVEFGDNTKAYSGSSIDLGVASRPLRQMVACAVISGITIDRLYESYTVPAVVEMSAAWEGPELTLAGVWSKSSGESSRFGIGQSLQVARDLPLGVSLTFLSGLRLDPIRYSLGARILARGGSLDYAYQSHPDLGGTHVLGVTFRFGGR